MASNIETIVSQVIGFTLQYNGQAISVRSGTTLPETPSNTDLPMRLVSAVGSSGGQVRRLTLGSRPLINFRWQITDIMLGQQVGLSRGTKDQSSALYTYASDYAQAIRNWSVTNTWQIEDCSIMIDTLELPSESGNYFYGVRCELFVKEIVQGE